MLLRDLFEVHKLRNTWWQKRADFTVLEISSELHDLTLHKYLNRSFNAIGVEMDGIRIDFTMQFAFITVCASLNQRWQNGVNYKYKLKGKFV